VGEPKSPLAVPYHFRTDQDWLDYYGEALPRINYQALSALKVTQVIQHRNLSTATSARQSVTST
jgi:hypothetical protein